MYEGELAACDCQTHFGGICVRVGETRDGGSYLARMARVRVWNTIMEDRKLSRTAVGRVPERVSAVPFSGRGR